jgi:hypothetical protein
MFNVFERYDLAEDSRPTYAALASELRLTAATVTNHLAAMRRELRRHVLDRLRELTSTDDEFEAEARRLLGTDVSERTRAALRPTEGDPEPDRGGDR